MKSLTRLAAGVLLLPGSVLAQSLTFTGTPLTGTCPRTVDLSWNSTGFASCMKLDSWSGTAALSGSQPVTVSAISSFTLSCTGVLGQADLSWTPPTQNTDGSALTNLAGYDLHQATTSAGVASSAATPVPLGNSHQVTGLGAGTKYFGLKSRTSSSALSVMSAIVNKTITVANVTSTVTATCDTPPPPPNTDPTITTPVAQIDTVGVAASLQIQAADVDGDALFYGASNLPAGLSINSGTGMISGVPTIAQSQNVFVSVNDGHGGSATTLAFAWAINSAPPPPPPEFKTVQTVVYDLGPMGGIGRLVGSVPLGVTCGAFHKLKNGKRYHQLSIPPVILTRTPRSSTVVGICAAT